MTEEQTLENGEAPRGKKKSERILDAVKERQNRQRESEAVEEKTVNLVIFTLGEDFYGFYGEEIKEILPYEPVTFVPGCPDNLLGVINVRGDIESVVNLHLMMGLSSPGEPTRSTRIVIASAEGIRSGILVDGVEDVLDVPHSHIKRPLATLDMAIREFAVGGETLYNEKYVTILDAGKIFSKIVQ